MALLPLLKYPDPLLKKSAEDITVYDDGLRQLADDLIETMRAAPGVGMAACHVGILKRLVVIEVESGSPRVYVNPRISWRSSEHVDANEGSVSMPGAIEKLSRPRSVRVVFNTLDGDMKEEEADGFLSICLQHEIDQLDGIFWLDRLSRLKRDRVIKRYKKSHVCAHEGCCAVS